MKMILFNQNPMIEKLLESVSKKLELSIENFNHYQELSARLKKDPEWLLIADDECLEKLDQVDWLELKETISQNKNSVCMYKKGNEAQPFLEGFEMKIKKPFLPTEMLKVLQKKLGSNASELEPSQNSDPTQEILETNWDELENLGDLEALAKEEPNNEEQLLPTLNEQEGETPKEEAQEEVKKEEVKEMQEEIKEKEKQEVAESPQDEEKPKDDETQGSVETPKEETQEQVETPKEETQEQVETPKEETQEQEPIKEETQEIKEEKQEKTQDSPSAQELEAMQELVKEIQENSNDQENKKETQETQETQENTETPQDIETQELEIPKEEETQEVAEKTQAQGLEKEEIAETPQEKETQETQETQENTETPQDIETQELEIPKEEETQEIAEKTQAQGLEKEEIAETPQEKEIQETQDETPQEDHYESIEDIPEPVMAKAMGEELPFLNENDTETPKENDTETPKESVIKTPQEKEESDKTSSPLELRLNLQDLLKSLNQESFKSLLENKTLSIKITLEDKKPNE
ncbi:chemotaxis regulatory protein ChePep [Helicobacter pylori]